jgi:protein-S-isoprenylcysteine O-methyltransferase Ste14
MNFSRIARRIRVPSGFLFAAVFLWQARPTLASILYSLPFVIAGVAFRAYASGYVNKNAALATSGPYAFTRNPLYLASFILGIGFVIASRSWIALLCFAVLFPLIYIPTILNEETWLRSHFPAFDEYARRVPRLFPRLTPARFASAPSPAGAFSRDLYLRHREYNALLGAVAVYGVLLLKMWLHRT